MPFEFIQIPANGQGSAKEELNKLLRGGRIASVRKEFVAHGEDSFWALLSEQRQQLPRREPQQQQPGQQQQQPGLPFRPQLRPGALEGAASSRGLDRSPSRSSPDPGGDKATKGPPGASSPVDAGSKTPGGPVLALCGRADSVGSTINNPQSTIINHQSNRHRRPALPPAFNL